MGMGMGMGMSDHSINTLKHLYHDTTCIVKFDHGGSACFTVNIGLRQGCPLSTTLFNLYIWDLHQHLVPDTKGAGVRLQGVADDEQLLVTDMEYADDATLCASSPTQLQDLINSFVAYCDKHGLTVNPKKCEVVVFAKSSRAWSGFGEWKNGRSKAKHCHGPASSNTLVLSYMIPQAPRDQLSTA